jgi:tetratricopeptide (TPR) repeat protein
MLPGSARRSSSAFGHGKKVEAAPMISSSPVRTKAFISYSHKDKRFLDELRRHLGFLEREGKVNSWDDTKIAPGSQWREEIKKAIASAKAAVLLVSADFLASEFIAQDELPPLLAAAQQEGAIILPVIVGPCLFADSNIAQFQAINSPSKPLRRMSPGQRDEVWVKVAQHMEEQLKLLPSQETSLPVSSPPRKTKEQWVDEGNAFLEINRYEEAIAAYDQALQLDPSLPYAYFKKGLALLKLKRYAEAIPILDQAIRLNPDEALAYNGKGFALLQFQQYKEAISLFDQALNHNSTVDYIYNNKGCAFFELGDYEKANRVFDEAIRLNPKRGRYYSNKGKALEHLQRSTEAKQAYRRAKRLTW